MVGVAKKAAIGLVILLALLWGGYKILSNITRYSIDKTVVVEPPSSPKSVPEYYAFGYQPELIYTEKRSQCSERVSTKQAMFGDLHIHTAISADAFPDGTRTFPDDVYRFAKGQAIDVPVQDGSGKRTMQLTQPLDFAAVTDHAETYGEGYICRTRGAFPGYDSDACQRFRAGGEEGVREFMGQNGVTRPKRDESVCGKDNRDCEAADKLVWDDMKRSAEEAYDRSPSCGFTSFVGYEYTRAPNAQHMHRNTIFRNAEVPARPATFFSHITNYELLTSFEKECRLGIDACDVISIPHNSNISGGNSFNPNYMDGFSERSQRAYWLLRNAYDRLMEITQHKGTSECINGITDILSDNDELCDVEQLRQFGKTEQAPEITAWLPALNDSDSPQCTGQYLDPKDNLYKGFCLSSWDFARGALLYGMEKEAKGGPNPFEFGFIGSTDTHISAAGGTGEAQWGGHIAYETNLKGRLGQAGIGRFNRLVSNPGGLAGVYAVENSRDAIFQSMKRREAFATTGPRIEPRFFAGRYPQDLCSNANWLALAYAGGTPMGSKLAGQLQPFQLLVQAKRDPLSNPLQKLQLIKGWIDRDGQKHNRVIDLNATGSGDNLCVVYNDPDYDAGVSTYYYMRAVETPTERWSETQCSALPANQRPVECENNMPTNISEMAWASPIWFTPDHKAPLAANGMSGHSD
ncbi:MAG: DUF3604 domain-containing protein [Sphingorhabdus sp.]